MIRPLIWLVAWAIISGITAGVWAALGWLHPGSSGPLPAALWCGIGAACIIGVGMRALYLMSIGGRSDKATSLTFGFFSGCVIFGIALGLLAR